MRASSRPSDLRKAALAAAFCLSGLVAAGCAPAREAPPPRPATSSAVEEAEYTRRRLALVNEELAPQIQDPRVLDAMRKVPRHLFVPPELREHAYEDTPLPIGEDQTISQPFVVALMTRLLELTPASKVLEIGTGSGYQAAVLAELAQNVYSIEIIEPLAKRAAETLKGVGYERVHLRTGDGYLGWPEAAPFDRIIVTCAPENVPQPLQDQLAEGGRLVIPVGPAGNQELVVEVKEDGKLVRREVIPVRFVPMTGPGVEGAGEHPVKPSPSGHLN
ncbi:MAG: protein-L-isoaspartate(D-aspartate) O-methyltransferase [bacterium]